MKERLLKKIEEISQKSTRFIGSSISLLLHTIIFVTFMVLILLGFDTNKVLLILTTIVSLEAIYLSIFIQMSVNRAEEQLTTVSEDISEVSDDLEDIQKDIDEVAQDIDEIQKDVDEIHDDIEDIQEDMDEVAHDIDEIQEDIGDIQEDLDEEETPTSSTQKEPDSINKIESLLEELQQEIARIKKDSR
ncbi:MAG TPA: hypothetical protein VGE63_01485 [Candidatus Paceibacterota bacterium]